MIINIDGKIGGGKTYFAVHYILKKYFQYDPIIDDWVPQKPLVLFTNIKGLKIDHISLDDEVRKRGLGGVFSMAFVDEMRQLYQCRIVLFVIDECQGPDFFHYRFKDPTVELFFQTIRHGGVDCFLITQDIDNVSRGIKTLAEYTVHVVARSFSGPGYFTYKKMIDGDILKTFRVKKSAEVFRCYKSMSMEEGEKVEKVYVRYFVIVGLLFMLVFCGWNYLFKPMYLKRAAPISKNILKPVAGPVKSVSHVVELKDLKASLASQSSPGPVGPAGPAGPAVVVLPVTAGAVENKIVSPACILTSRVALGNDVYEVKQCGDRLDHYTNGVLDNFSKTFRGEGNGTRSARAPEGAEGAARVMNGFSVIADAVKR